MESASAAATVPFVTLKERHREEKRTLIISAAAGVFAEKGPRSATVTDVARAAGLSPGAIYLYFSSREDLLFGTALAEIDDLEGRMRHALDAGEPADATLRAMMSGYLAFYCERPQGFRMLLAGLERPARRKADPQLVAEYDRRAQGCLALLHEVVRRGMADGNFAAGDALELTNVIWGAMHGILQLAVEQDPERFLGYDVRQLFDRTADALLDGIRAGRVGEA